MADAPLMLRYEGDGEFRTISGFWAGRADRAYVCGEVYKMVEYHDRSMNSHRHFFATINEAWKNLPEELAGEFPSPEHLRKKALIGTGYRDERLIVCPDVETAGKVGAFISPMDDHAVVVINGDVVRVYTAKSQSVKAMPNGEFQRSKSDVLDFVADLLGVTTDDLSKAEAA